MQCQASICGLLSMLFSIAWTVTAAAEPALLLERRTGLILERTARAGQVDRWQLWLEAGEYLDLTVEQRQVDIVLELRDPTGLNQLRVDSPTFDLGPERIEFEAATSGTHQLLISVSHADDHHGTYELQLKQLRPATPRDRQRAMAAERLAQAEEQRRQGDRIDQALPLYREAVARWRSLNDHRELAMALERSGYALLKAGQRAAALQIYQQADELFIKLALNDLRTASMWANMGMIQRYFGQLEEAARSYDRALESVARFDEPEMQAQILNNLGRLKSASGRLREASSFYRRSIELRRRSGFANPGMALNNLGGLNILLGEPGTALDLLAQAREANRDLSQVAMSLKLSADAQRELGNREQAAALYRQAHQLYERLGDRTRQGHILVGLGRLAILQHKTDLAQRWFHRAEDLFGALQDHRGQTLVLHGLGTAAALDGALE